MATPTHTPDILVVTSMTGCVLLRMPRSIEPLLQLSSCDVPGSRVAAHVYTADVASATYAPSCQGLDPSSYKEEEEFEPN